MRPQASAIQWLTTAALLMVLNPVIAIAEQPPGAAEGQSTALGQALPAAGGWVVVEPSAADRKSAPDDPDWRSPSRIPVVEPAPPLSPREVEKPEPAAGEGRSFGGAPVTPGTSVWQAEIYRQISDARWAEHLKNHPSDSRPKWQLQHWCGAALIADDWVLTAAHCILVDEKDSDPLLKADFVSRRDRLTVSRAGKIPLSRCVAADIVISGFRVRLGADDVSRDDGVTFRIDCAVVHPGWNPADIFHDDIALVHFAPDGPAPPRDPSKVRQIRVHKGPSPPEGTSVTVTGWGKTKPVQGFAPSAVLMQVALSVQSQPLCAGRLGVGPDALHSNVICAGAPARKTCLGDSGGPVVFTEGRPTYLVGVVSWGNADCTADAAPGVYTRVAAYNQWIDDVLDASR